MTLLKTLDIAASGMSAQRVRMNVAAMNLANKNTTRTEDGGPYRRRDVVLETASVTTNEFGTGADSLRRSDAVGVKVADIAISNDDPVMLYDPGHPDADPQGYVAMPNVSSIKEMVNMLGAARAYEAGTTVMKSVRDMAEQALRIGK